MLPTIYNSFASYPRDNNIATNESLIQSDNHAYPKLIKITLEELRQFNIVNSFTKSNEPRAAKIEIDLNIRV